MIDDALVFEFKRLLIAKQNLRALIQICDDMEPRAEREALFAKVRKIIDALESEANNLRDWGKAFREVPEIH